MPNSQPIIDAELSTLSGGTDEQADTTGDIVTQLSAGGTIVFTDVDLADTHSIPTPTLVSVVWSGGEIENVDPGGSFIFGDESSGSIDWTYKITDSLVDFLGVDETLVITYSVAVSDSSGAENATSETQPIVVTITGADDVPDAVDDVVETAEDAGSVIIPKEINGSVFDNDTDADANDTLTVSAVAKGATGELSDITTNVDVELVGDHGTLVLKADGSYTYSFFNTDEAKTGETIYDAFHYQVSDRHGGVDDATLTFNIAGTDLDLTITPGPDEPHDADPFIAQRGNDTVQGTEGVDTIEGHEGNDTLYGYGDNDTLYGQEGDDQLLGGEGDDHLIGADGNDVASGAAGNDTITGGTGTGIDIYDGGTDTDLLDYSSTTLGVTVDLTPIDRSAQSIAGPDDLITIGALLVAGGYSETQPVGYAVGSEIDTDAILNIENVTGGSGDDTITGDGADNILHGGDGDDHLVGAGGNDVAAGDAGDDTITGGTGTGFDIYDGGTDTDFLDYSSTTLGVTVDLTPIDRSAQPIPGPDTLTTIGALLVAGGYSATQPVGYAVGSEIDTDAILNIENVTGGSGDDSVTGDGADNIFHGGDGEDHLVGAGGNDFVHGDAGNDTITGGTGTGFDIYDGGTDTDLLDYSSTTLGVTVDLTPIDRSAQPIPGPDTLTTIGALLVAGGYSATQPVGYAVGSEIDTDAILNIENVTGGSGDDSITGDGVANVLHGGLGSDVLRGAGGADTFFGEEGRDYVHGGSGNDTIVSGLAGTDSDVYDGGDDVDTVDYSTTTLGINVNLTAVNRSLEAVATADGPGGDEPDTIGALLNSFVLSATAPVGRADGAEIGTDVLSGIENVIGGSGNDIFVGDAAANTFEGGDGNDQMWARAGNDRLYGGEGNDTLVGGFGGSGTPPPSGDDTLFGDAGNDSLYGEDGNDILWGGAGIDQYAGGAGNDILYFEGDGASDTAWGGTDSDTFVFQQGFGNDLIKDFSAVGFTGDKIDLTAFTNLTFSGLTIRSVQSNGLTNVEITSAAFGAGNKITLESLNIGAVTADDFIFYSNPNVSLTVNGNSSINFLVGGAGNDTINGLGGADFLSGLGGNDTLNGGDGDDMLNGGAGNDNMFGGNGNDTYVVDSAGDTLTEGSGAGTDLVQSLVSFTLGNNFENLTLTASGNINGTGNTAANVITGNAGNNILSGLGGNDKLNGGEGDDTLDGGAGSDAMTGGNGNDTYVVDSTGDTITEASGGGTDLVKSSITYTLGANLEDLVLTGSANINGTGNTGANVISGNGGNNVLNGSGGIDTLSYANAGGGVTVSLALTTAQATGGAGTDTISNFENLTGSNSGDHLTGSSGANVLKGGGGLDTVTGGGGADFFAFDFANLGLDTITDFLIGTDKLQISTAGFGGALGIGGSAPLFSLDDISGFDSGSAAGYFFFDNDGAGRGMVYWDATGGSSADAVAFANIGATATLLSSDFLLV